MLLQHADTLLQITEVYRHREGEYCFFPCFVPLIIYRTLAGSNQALFTFTSGLNKLNFNRVENRPFFLALHYHVMCAFAFNLFLNHASGALVVTYNDEDVEGAGEDRDEEGRDREHLNAVDYRCSA
jgi:hypothetical protein